MSKSKSPQSTSAEVAPVTSITPTSLPQEPVTVVPQSDPNSLIALAVQQGANVETLERLFALHEKVEANKAKTAFIREMSQLQSELPVIKKLKQGDKAKYAPLEDIVELVGPHIRNRGFSYRWNTNQDAESIKVFCIATHVEGHSEQVEMSAPVEEIVTGKDSGKATKSGPQRVASTITFLKRYTFCNLFGVNVAGEDFDGRVQQQRPKLPPNPKAKIMALLKSMNYDTSDAQVIRETVMKLTAEELVDANLEIIIDKLHVVYDEYKSAQS